MAAVAAALAERRQVRRVSAEEAGWQEEAVLRPGLLVRIVNISAIGVLLESPARLRPGRRAELQLTSSAGDTSGFNSVGVSVAGSALACWAAFVLMAPLSSIESNTTLARRRAASPIRMGS